MSDKNETWQVICDAGIFETDLEGLKGWVAEGRVLPHDKVRKGNLRWIEAGLAPVLREAFAGAPAPAWAGNPSNAVAVSEAVPVETGFTAEPQQAGFEDESFAEEHEHYQEPHGASTASDPFTQSQALYGAVCYFHQDLQPKYICRSCANTFCQECTKFTSKIPLCPLCGELCKLYEEIKEKSQRRLQQYSGFGVEDFGTALSFPFRNIFGLLGGAFIYGLLLLGGFKGQLLAYAILFGCISLVINKVVAGRMDGNFLPDFSSFSLLDDFVMPILLGIGVTIVTIGPAIVLGIALIMGIINSTNSSPVDRMKSQYKQEEKTLTPEDMQKLVNGADEKGEEELKKKIEEMHPGSSVARMAEKSKDSDQSSVDTLRWLFSVPVFIIPFLLLALAWAVFYYPMALSIAGYTEDFWSVVNPLVGLDTIRRMGMTYFKAFGMYLSVQVVGSILSAIAYAVLAPFDMPFIGNLPARFVEGTITFYTSLVIACILGLALYKSADKLGISTE
ncbi:MAG TPA: hypothetical protein VGC66_07950 [Pyrinomonadaceae bacterium]|jgi:hypothetical protein